MKIERWYSVTEIALHLGVSKETVYRWLDQNQIPGHKVGKLWKFSPSEINKWVKAGGATHRISKPKGKK